MLSFLQITLSSSHTPDEESIVAPSTLGSSPGWCSSAQPVLASPLSQTYPFLSSQWTKKHATSNVDMIINLRFL